MIIIILLFFAIISPIITKRNHSRSLTISALFIFTFIALNSFSFFQVATHNVLTRFENASNTEGSLMKGTIGTRYFGSYIRAFTDTQNFTQKEIPSTGFGMGIGTKVGERLLGISNPRKPFAVAEEEWSRIICEMGFLLGGITLLLRLFLSIIISFKAIKKSVYNLDLLPFIFIPFFFLFMINRQWGVPTLLGFSVIIGSLQLSAINTSKKYDN